MALGASSLSSSSDAITVAKAFAKASFGLTDPSLVADTFNVVYSHVKSKSQYLQGIGVQYSSLTRAVPNLDFRPFGFTTDTETPNKVWFKIRPSGTISGPFSSRGEVYLPKNAPIEFPTQQLSVTVPLPTLCSFVTP
jgi:hypothetical protein